LKAEVDRLRRFLLGELAALLLGLALPLPLPLPVLLLLLLFDGPKECWLEMWRPFVGGRERIPVVCGEREERGGGETLDVLKVGPEGELAESEREFEWGRGWTSDVREGDEREVVRCPLGEIEREEDEEEEDDDDEEEDEEREEEEGEKEEEGDFDIVPKEGD